MKTKITIDDRGNVVDFYYGDEFIAKLDREATVNGVDDQKEFHLLNVTHGKKLEEFLVDNPFLMFEVKKAKKVIHNIVCKRMLVNCEHSLCVCKNCDSGLEQKEKCSTCDYSDCCDKELNENT